VKLRVMAGPFELTASMEEARAPATCAAFREALPFRSRIIHARWSGEAAWIPLGDLEFGVAHENATSHPAAGQILLYPGGISETEILVPYGGCRFSSIVGQLAGNHFLTVVDGLSGLRSLGEHVLWNGALDVVFEPAPA
jgi:Protein of unknown function (DUF3830)